MRPSGVHHVALETVDPARLASFYSGALGLVERERHHDERGLRSVWLEVGATILMLERSDRGDRRLREGDPPGLHLLALAIRAEDAPLWRARLPILSETAFTLYATDPEGNRIGLSSFPERLAP